MAKTKIKLGAKDAALVIRANGNFETFLPEQDPEEKALETTIMVAALAKAITDERLMNALIKNLRTPIPEEEKPLIIIPGKG